jgi:hypothetical protein
MSEQEIQYPELPTEFTGLRLLNLTQAQTDELVSLYGQDALGDRFYDYIHELPRPSEKQ